jgi:two-component system KDP operon response regulator KdpE
VCRDGVEVRLTPIEWRLVEVPVKHAGHLVSREHLLACVWGSDKAAGVHALRVHMAAIRRKLEPDRDTPCYFVTVPGLGVRFQPGA